MVSHLLRKLLRVDLSDLPMLVGPGINPPGPTPDRGNANREPLRGFSSAPGLPSTVPTEHADERVQDMS